MKTIHLSAQFLPVGYDPKNSTANINSKYHEVLASSRQECTNKYTHFAVRDTEGLGLIGQVKRSKNATQTTPAERKRYMIMDPDQSSASNQIRLDRV
jgi:hypothetical protein